MKRPGGLGVMEAFTALTMLNIMVNGQTTCNQGMGRVMYERLPNQQLQGFDDDVVRDTAPPFRVLEKCQDLCLRDRSANSLVRRCSSFDFQPGGRIAAFSGTPEYEESTCYLTSEQAAPEGIGNLMLVPNSVHFNEICLSSNRPERECPSRRYVFERHARKKLKLPSTDLKEFIASNRTECEDKCLNEFSFVCRSASYDVSLRTCSLSRFTRRTHPELLEDDHNSDYLENTCLNAERRCDGLAVFIKEENKRLGGPFEADVFSNMTLDECQAMCIRSEKYFCRSVEYDETTKQCIASEEDSVSQKDDITVSSSPTHHFYDLVCLDNPRGSEYPDNSATSHLFSNGRRPDTAFQRYRNSRLGGEFHSEITGRSLSECLDECLRQTSFQCRSAVYSDRFRTCRLSRFNQKDGMRIIYDADYDYYENLMHQLLGSDGDGAAGSPGGGSGGSTRPDSSGPWAKPGGPADRYPEDDRYPDDDRYPVGDKYPTRPDRYPASGGRYPAVDDRYPTGGDGYPASGGRYPDDRYPESDGYPGSGNRYPTEGDRYPGGGPRYPIDDRYPMSGAGRYPISDRYPSTDRRPTIDRYPVSPSIDYPIAGDRGRYPADRSPPPLGRYPMDRYPVDDRYPLDRFPSSGGGRYPTRPTYPGRYPADSNRYPNEVDHYPVSPSDWGRYPYSRYPVGVNRDRYPTNRYPGGDDRYPDMYDRYPPTGSSYPGYGRGGYPIGDGYDSNRYPGGGIRPDRYGPDRDRPSYGSGGGYRRPVERPNGYRGQNIPPIGYDRPAIVPGGGGGVGAAGGYPPYESPAYGPGEGGPSRPGAYGSRCEDESFKQVGSRQRMQRRFVRRLSTAQSLAHCQRECIEARDFICRSFNYRDSGTAYGDAPSERDSCELSDRDTRDMDVGNPQHFESGSGYDFYERSLGRSGGDDCLDVSQVCNEDGMEFTLRVPEGFYGRIYTYGFYDRCFFRGNGGNTNVLRISGSHGYPECGTQRFGDTMTNIVVVQFSDNVQTGRDKRFNLTCLFRGPAEAVVTSNYIGAGWAGVDSVDRSGSPIPIEYLPEESSLNSKVRLMILYQGRPTTTIAVGDPLTFRLEAQEGQPYNYAADIFATNVVARDPYTGRSVQLIDRAGCPVDSFVFPELDKGRSGDSLEARFNAFKIPESNFLVFEATVRTCREGCQPAYCPSNTGRSEPSFGRRKRDVNSTSLEMEHRSVSLNLNNSEEKNSTFDVYKVSYENAPVDQYLEVNAEAETPKHVRKMIEVFDNRNELSEAAVAVGSSAPAAVAVAAAVCVSPGSYRAMLTAIVTLVCLLLTVLVLTVYGYRRYWAVMRKNVALERPIHPPTFAPPRVPGTRTSLFGSNLMQKPFAVSGLGRMCEATGRTPSTSALQVSGNGFDDPSEPIYTDPSLFERSRSLRSLDRDLDMGLGHTSRHDDLSKHIM